MFLTPFYSFPVLVVFISESRYLTIGERVISMPLNIRQCNFLHFFEVKGSTSVTLSKKTIFLHSSIAFRSIANAYSDYRCVYVIVSK